ncbi:class I SAM-dependent methyltransferase [Methylobacterium sp. J-070]|uniref:class I SAM-dependent methyltransferase n=1 Tax=Methylobacterium sp. J-070 TaxID=2836650 RepID=UPI001FBB1496|nr:class I SAM-dependent methyltransferase [Methylobacterium sp. J-070]MCJ2053315.1 class I SAM-dependent methyltransferase [Methylobacterium sp. J-070]
MPTKEDNRRVWGREWKWEGDGDEFHQFATEFGQNYDVWKSALVKEFIDPFFGNATAIAEIGCGHGRWSNYFVGLGKQIFLQDLALECVDYCRKRFGPDAATYITSDGDLSAIPDQGVDFIWSFDVLVHVESADVEQYMKEIGRILKVGGTCVLHHADTNSKGHWRSDMTALLMRDFAHRNGLVVKCQRDSFGDKYQYSVRLAGDVISIIEKFD